MPDHLNSSDKKERIIIKVGLVGAFFLLISFFIPEIDDSLRQQLIIVFTLILIISITLLLYTALKTNAFLVPDSLKEKIDRPPMISTPALEEKERELSLIEVADQQDITMEKIREIDKIKSRFFDQISHEFRTPLTLILGPLGELIRKNQDPEDLQQLRLMQLNGQKLLHLLNDLLELSKINAGMLSLDTKPENLNQLIQSVAISLQPLAIQKKIQTTVDLPETSLTIDLDYKKIETVLNSLLSNIIKLTPTGSSISIFTEEKDGLVHIMISNTGPTIPDPIANKIFDLFYRIEDTDQNNEDGYGIGLALSKQLASMHGGNIELITSLQGNHFDLSLPNDLASPASQPIEEDVSETLLGHEAHVEFELETKRPVLLIVEDSEQLRMFLNKILNDSYELLTASNGKEGLEAGLIHVPDLIISDIMMPEMDGLELCRRVKGSEITSHIPVILLTALADMDSRLEGLDTGADYYLPKPFEPRELLTATNNLIIQRRKLRERFSKKILLKSQELDAESGDERFLKKLITFIEQNLTQPDFKIEDLQKDMGISRMQLHRKLKALTDKSATEFVRAIRLKKAAEILLKGHENVSQVAYQVGFSSLSYFTKCFKEQFGILPSAYQNDKKKPLID